MEIFDKSTLISFDGLYNFRDIGGHMNTSGKKMKTNMLYRSDDLSRLSQKDIEKIKELHIQLICDLRTPSEQNSKPSRMIDQENITIVTISVYDQSQEYSRFEFFKYLINKANTIDFEQVMKDMYHNMAFTSNGEIKSILQLLSQQHNTPALIHCTGGKDRTGFISAIIQLLVGIPYDTVIKDYLFSNELIVPRMKKIGRFIQWMSLFQASPERIKPMLEVRREYLDEIYNKIINKYGNIETYLCQACNVEQDHLNDLKRILLE